MRLGTYAMGCRRDEAALNGFGIRGDTASVRAEPFGGR
ncbi:hypothetical protein M878_02645 [Streptomyces roseochromogenus subsp. oscitans DS 12.976]|uniref:Uncharacterized protein n=1 Tax=Streptomyces roseochromogenus subsp. oscitans DS 12.976 TaxID=1352936 RepID=V6L4Z7_STRRC|nr:hypothetical protein M878_02645 [Streptomyces roseochromogenus subsp. oscitans DS 12.976]